MKTVIELSLIFDGECPLMSHFHNSSVLIMMKSEFYLIEKTPCLKGFPRVPKTGLEPVRSIKIEGF